MITTWIKFAAANLLRNRRRSFYTIIAIAMGFAAVNVFGGFTAYIFKNLGDSFIYTQANGHLTIFKKGFLAEGRIDPLKYLISQDEAKVVREVCAQIPEITLSTPQLQIMGLLSNGNVSAIFVGNGRVPSDTVRIQNMAGGMLAEIKHTFFDGRMLQDDVPQGAGLSFGLADKLQLKLGSEAVAMAPTVDGRVNALDIEVFQTFSVPVEELNDKILSTPLKFAQSLYDTESVDRVTVVVAGPESGQIKSALETRLSQAGLSMEVKSWRDLNPFYNKVKKMFDIIFVFIFIIMFVIAVTSVINTLSMSVIERTREIGTLRALGLRRSGITRLFAIESAMLGFMGCGTGLLLTGLAWLLIKTLKPQWIPPNIVHPIPLEIYLVPAYLLTSFIFLVCLSTLVAVLPAHKAACRSIVDALGHV